MSQVVYGDPAPVDARWPRLACPPPMYAAFVFGVDEPPLRTFSCYAEAERWMDSAEAEALEDVIVRPWQPEH